MRSQLRIADLKRGTKGPSRLMNVRVPTHVAEAVDRLSRQLDVSKTEVIVALLNEGLTMATKAARGRRRK